MSFRQAASPCPDSAPSKLPPTGSRLCHYGAYGRAVYTVILDITGIHIEDGEEETTGLYTEGSLTLGDSGRCILEFTELDASGRDGIPVKFTLHDKELTVERGDQGSSCFMFRPHRVFETAYITPFGVLQMSLFPLKLETEIASDRGSIELEYAIRLGDQRAVNRLSVQYRRKNAKPAQQYRS